MAQEEEEETEKEEEDEASEEGESEEDDLDIVNGHVVNGQQIRILQYLSHIDDYLPEFTKHFQIHVHKIVSNESMYTRLVIAIHFQGASSTPSSICNNYISYWYVKFRC